jgi:hypothetical protein
VTKTAINATETNFASGMVAAPVRSSPDPLQLFCNLIDLAPF